MGNRELGNYYSGKGNGKESRESTIPYLFPSPFPAFVVAQFPIPHSQFPVCSDAP